MATATTETTTFSKRTKPIESAGAASTDPRSGKYLTFRLAREEFAIAVLRVREIMGMQDITAVPQTPHYMKGVINLRGKIVPVIDLRMKFGFPEVEATPATCIIVCWWTRFPKC
jgi:purine-binding chemotaxis protein CheW